MKKSIGSRLIDSLLIVIMLFVVVVTLYPFLNILAISMNDSIDSVKGGITVFPRKFTMSNYTFIFSYNNLLHAFFISVARTLIGTLLGILATAMLAYTLSREDYMFRKPITLLFVLTMYISGGLIPDYMVIKNLHLINNFAVYILPGLLSAFNLIIIRSYIDGLPISLQESAKLDGANDFVIFWRIILPLCTPVIATVALFIAVGQWNSWFDTYLYASSKQSLSTLQFEMMRIMSDTAAAQAMAQRAAMSGGSTTAATVSPESIRMAITVVATVPILIVYPFIQQYFIKGMTLGAVKN